MAEDYIRMGCAEVKKMTLPEGNPAAVTSVAYWCGWWRVRLTAALEASKAGYKVVLVEKSGALGGWAAKLYKRSPGKSPYAEPQDTPVADMDAAIAADANIKSTSTPSPAKLRFTWKI